MPYFSDRAVSVIRHAIHQDRYPARSIALIADLFVGHPFQFAGTSLDGAINRIARHIGRQGLVDRGAQPRIGRTVSAPCSGGHGDFPNQFGEQLAAFRILSGFPKLDVGPLAMPRHSYLLLTRNTLKSTL